MLAASASLLNICTIILDTGTNAPAEQVLAPSDHINGSFADADRIWEWESKVDILTVKIKHVNVNVLAEIAKTNPNVRIHPDPQTLSIKEDKYRQMVHLEAHGSPISPYMQVEATLEGIQAAAKQLLLPLMLKKPYSCVRWPRLLRPG